MQSFNFKFSRVSWLAVCASLRRRSVVREEDVADIVATISQFSTQFKLKRVTAELVDKDPQRKSLTIRSWELTCPGIKVERRLIFLFAVST